MLLKTKDPPRVLPVEGGFPMKTHIADGVKMSDRTIGGIVASPGIRIGKAYLYKGAKIVIPKYTIAENEIEGEIARFYAAREKTRDEIRSIQAQMAQNLSEDMADIFASHIMALDDPVIQQRAIDAIRKNRKNVEWAINDLSVELIATFESIEDEYMRERIIDISDIHKRLISNLQKIEYQSLAHLKEEVIVFAQDLTPSDTALMNRENVLAFVTDKGGRTSHTAILARALEIPAIVGTVSATSNIRNGDLVIVDGLHGQVIINPSREEIAEYIKYQEDLLILELELSKMTRLPAVTIDEIKIDIVGNIELPEEVQVIRDHGAEGIGLFRSEFLFLDKQLPDEDKQVDSYKSVIEFFAPLPVTIRTIDVGGDKVYALSDQYRERNPFLGCRAIRFSLAHIPMFKTQLRAILRASAYGKVKLMFPMISSAEELIRAREILDEVRYSLRSEGVPFDEEMPVGIMIEVPSAVLNADILSRHADFFSVGTNDLIQYTLAVDRIGEKVAYLYNPVDLSVLRMLRMVADAGRAHNVPLSICGEIAGEPKYTMMLLGLGFRSLSMSAAYMFQVKQVIRSVTITECEALVEKLFTFEKTSEAEKYLSEINKSKFPFLAVG
jgi:phosphotransferase system enzyme I (PtsI)